LNDSGRERSHVAVDINTKIFPAIDTATEAGKVKIPMRNIHTRARARNPLEGKTRLGADANGAATTESTATTTSEKAVNLRALRRLRRLLRGSPRGSPHRFHFSTKRRLEIEAHAKYIGAADTDDLSRWLIAWLWHFPNLHSHDPVRTVIQAALKMGKLDFAEAEAKAVIDEARATPRQMESDALARWLGLTYQVRNRIGITTIGSADVDKHERKARRKARDRFAKEQRRRKRGRQPRAKWLAQRLTRTRPWEALGICRRT
jgi:hypothetical protein